MAAPFETGTKKIEEPKKELTLAEVASTAAAAAAKAVMEEALPAMVAAMGAQGQTNARQRGPVDVGPKCHVCQQALRACKGEHVNMAVYPTRYPEFGQWFQGIRINGICYISNDGGHEIPVPAGAASDIKSMVQRYEDSERTARMGRIFQPSRNKVSVDSSGSPSGDFR